MRSELRCEDVRPNVSAHLDHELEPEERRAINAHLATCSECRAYADRIAQVRQLVRLQPAVEVPDLTEKISAAIANQEASAPSLFRGGVGSYLRTAAVAAVAAFLLFMGVSSDVFDRTPDVATASEIVRNVQAAARDLTTYRATFSIVERGWHPDVPVRKMEADVWFAAPERFRLAIADETTYPTSEWPRNEVQLVSSPKRWAITEPSTCPTQSLPACGSTTVEERTIVDRQPFDGNSALPTDIAIPIETLSDADALEVVSSTPERHRVALAYHQAAPLVEALQPGGTWRPFHPLDRVEVWIDRETWFPYRFRVVAGSSADRDLWAERFGVDEEPPGTVLFDVEATEFAEPAELEPELFRAPVAGAVSSGGFEAVPGGVSGLQPTYTAGLTPYREGAAGGSTSMQTFVEGMTWLKVAYLPEDGATEAFAGGAEIVRVGAGRGFYRPADGRNGRRVDIYGPTSVRVESNLERSEVLRVAASLGIAGSVPDSVTTADGSVVRRLEPSAVSDEIPGWTPDGFELVSVVRSEGTRDNSTLTLYYAQDETSFEGRGIRIVRANGPATLPPSSEEFINVRVNTALARWSFERSELEWIQDDAYRAVQVPGADLATALRVAESLP